MIHTSFFLAHSAIAFSSGRVYTAPVGLHGEQRMSPLVRVVEWLSSSLAPTFSPHSMSPGTSTGSARQRWTICGYDTHAGAGISTWSLGPKRVKQALKSECFEPELTRMLSALTGRPPLKAERFFAMADRSSGMPGFGG
jgi:hypothetical protein